MNIKHAKYIGILFLLVSISCRHDFNFNEILNNKTEFVLTINISNDYVPTNKTTKGLGLDSIQIVGLKEWLKDNSNNWMKSFDSWATPSYSIISDDFRFLVFGDFVVVGFNDKSNLAVQYTRAANLKDFDFLKN